MTGISAPPSYSPPLLIATQGPTVTAYVNGVAVARVAMTPTAALYLASQLITLSAMRLPEQTTTPTENLTFADHIARRDAMRGTNTGADE